MIIALLTLPVLLYQLLFVVIMYIASRYGPKAMVIALVVSLVWTVTHLFFPPLAILQSAVIIGSYFWFKPKPKTLMLSDQTAQSQDEKPPE